MLLEITLQGLLSFGPATPPLILGPLNVFIGPNGSGKSNLIEALALLRASARDMSAGFEGGFVDWIWKGNSAGIARLEVLMANPNGQQPLRHHLSFRAQNQSFALVDERIENQSPYAGQTDTYFYYRYLNGQPVINIQNGQRRLQRDTIAPNQSILSQRRDPETYPEISHLARVYENIRLYREWAFGRKTVFRIPQRADVSNVRLEEDFSNLGMFLSRLRRNKRAKEAVLEALRDLYAGIDDYEIAVEGGTVQVTFNEGEYNIPATRLSDGTLRYLCLLALLCDPEPPALIAIEEPELGLHPDVLPRLAALLREASTRTQLVVTTHSDVLVDALSNTPESIVVCEKHAGQTHFRRLEAEALQPWLADYSLGQLWTRGELGGTRW